MRLHRRSEGVRAPPNERVCCLRPASQAAIAAASSYLNAGHFDEGVVHSLQRLGEYEALAVSGVYCGSGERGQGGGWKRAAGWVPQAAQDFSRALLCAHLWSPQVLDEVMLNDLGTVRNIPAYIMGICKRHRV